MEKPELEAEVEAALNGEGNGGATPAQEEISITNENALIVMAQALVGIEKHLFALAYLENTRDPDKTGVTYIADVFRAIYDGSDPFQEVRDSMERAAAEAKAEKS